MAPKKLKILVVDDQESVRRLVMRLLVRAGYEVMEAETATEAFDLCQEQRFNAIVTDFILPDINGIELLLSLHQKGSAVPALLMSGDRHYRNGSASFPGKIKFLDKPFLAADLVDAVTELTA